jgi:hypothetical protein
MTDDLEQRLRTALHADAQNARVSPQAWTRVSARLATARPRSHRGRSIGLAVAGAAALATVGAIVAPQLLRSPEPGPETFGSSTPGSTPSVAVVAKPREIGSLDVGVDARVRLVLRPAGDGSATVRLTAFRHQATSWRPLAGEVEVSRVANAGARVGVCQLRVLNGRTKQVTVSLAAAGAACSKPARYAISGSRLVPVS